MHQGGIFKDTIAGGYNSLDRNRNAQVFADDSLFAAAYATEKKSLPGQGLMEFIDDFGVWTA